MDKLLALVRREYVARVRSKWFIWTTLLAPVLLIGAMALPVILATQQAERALRVSVVDESGRILPELLETDAFSGGRFRFIPAPKSGTDPREELRRRVIDGLLDGYVYLPADVLGSGGAEYWTREGISPAEGLSGAITAAVQRVRASSLGLDPGAAQELTRQTRLRTYRVTAEGKARDQGQTVVAAHILGLIIYTVVLLYGSMMLRAAVAEKATKTVEIILSSVRPWQLMLGKTLGVGAVGLTQIGIWLMLVAVFLVYAGAAQAFADIEAMRDLPIGLDTLILFLGLFVTGYFVFGGMYASAGAIASSEQEASQLQIPVTIIAIIPILLIILVLDAPSSTLAIVLSWIPFFTPVLFLARYILGAVRGWEIPVVFALQLFTIVIVAWVGGRIYRLGLLMTGKRPTLPELIRWVRHG
ncbi:MAG: ABC transporter permease [Gemmatimonadetes bacterium]|uniref:ABC transporter permease n=1 Tax=Candidatus Kutchimonas denitrificans TaxID=3056748 RepID=A0AAE5CC49_9BACT|nr:ABC transporter permease [Gemmatimonadota bacterium]NIR75318.1 ABC transporter permease [Candidatus Kutchimonas denitrificans]NIS02144.1 ABC transporter permease [Gemmatimonadota bacterium]NIT67969.1 ABC transporter permease [Gemmatimonadota bacterium]NIU53963.1 ABC transporter permease [Gemmatimonadota bacterium]